MECEHFFPFLEAQLFWSLQMPTIMDFSNAPDDIRLKRKNLLNREYGPVCKKCNGAMHKTGLPILELNNDWRGQRGFSRPFKLATTTVQRIAKDSLRSVGISLPPPGRPKNPNTNAKSNVLNKANRDKRLRNVFRPLVAYINNELGHLNSRRIIEIMLLRYFYHFNETTLNKVFASILNGEDIIGQAQTGTGKTAAFALPLLDNIDLNLNAPQLLILAPTRELAIQVSEAVQTYARGMKGFHVLPIYGGQSYDIQLRPLKRGVHCIVGTPGRVMDHIKKGTLNKIKVGRRVFFRRSEITNR